MNKPSQRWYDQWGTFLKFFLALMAALTVMGTVGNQLFGWSFGGNTDDIRLLKRADTSQMLQLDSLRRRVNLLNNRSDATFRLLCVMADKRDRDASGVLCPRPEEE